MNPLTLNRTFTPPPFVEINLEDDDHPTSENGMLFYHWPNGVLYLDALIQVTKGNIEKANEIRDLINTGKKIETSCPWEEENPAHIETLFDRFFLSYIAYRPQLLSELGLFETIGIQHHNAYLDSFSPAVIRAMAEKKMGIYNSLDKYRIAHLSPEEKTSFKIFNWLLKNECEGLRYLFHDFIFSQLQGVFQQLTMTLVNFHKIKNKEDLDNYISRLNKIPQQLTEALQTLELQNRCAIILPAFAIKHVIGMIDKFTVEPIEENVLYQDVAKKITAIGLENISIILAKVKSIISEKIYPAYRMIRAHFVEQLPVAKENGAWALPDGDNYYLYALKTHTTTNLTPDEIHDIGLREVDKIQKEMRSLLAEAGIADPEKPLGELMQQLAKDDKFYFPNSEEGRKACIAEFESILERGRTELWPLFDIKPKAKLNVQQVPVHEQDGSAAAFYVSPSIDGTRQGIFFINLRNLREVPKYGMETLAVHEAEPGHHFQCTLQNEMPIPIMRKLGSYTAYVEGWALYTEKLALEQGFYSSNFAKLGHYQDELLRAVRLVVDTGIHKKRWTREQAIDYMFAATGYDKDTVISEIERYFVLPGQACAYKIGQLKILELRQRAKDRLGDKFDIRQFHNVILKIAATPLEILEEAVEDYIKQT